MEVLTMIPLTPVAGNADPGVDSLGAPALPYDNERPSRLGSPLGTRDNGNAQIEENERRLRLAPPLANPHTTVITVKSWSAEHRRSRSARRLHTEVEAQTLMNAVERP
jgi:hypothetical protein